LAVAFTKGDVALAAMKPIIALLRGKEITQPFIGKSRPFMRKKCREKSDISQKRTPTCLIPDHFSNPPLPAALSRTFSHLSRPSADEWFSSNALLPRNL
jgi:hypothetical protein